MRVLALLLWVPIAASAQSIQVLPRAATDPVGVVVTGSGHQLDWVALTPSVSPDASYVNWYYLNGSKAQPQAIISDPATVTFPVPVSGAYTVRLFANNTLAVKLATSEVITVGSGQPSADTIMFNGDSITAPYNITGAQNWTAIVSAALGYTSILNIAGNDKYAADVLSEVPSMSGHVCMVMIGTNDMVGGVFSGVSAADSRNAYLSVMKNVVSGLKARCGRVVILTPPLSMSARETLRWPAVVDGLRLICVEQGVTFLDLFHYMADLSAIKADTVVASWYSDWRHLTAAGHAVVAEFVTRSVKVTP